MANSIETKSVYLAEKLDEQFIKGSVTAILEGNNDLLKFDGAKTVYIPSLTLSGLGDYDRSKGFPEGDVNLEYTPYQMNMDRARSFSIDAVTDDEAGALFGRLASTFMTRKVIPEVDAYRLSKLLANSANVTQKETLTAANVVSKLNADTKLLDDNEVPHEECIRFISTEVNNLLKESTQIQKLITQSEYKVGELTFAVKVYDEIPLIVVPKTRFYSNYTFGADGFEKTEGAVEINYLTVHKDSAICVKKHERVRTFSPEVNQKKDAWEFQYRLHHDCITPKNKQVGITASVKGVYNATLLKDGSAESKTAIDSKKVVTA